VYVTVLPETSKIADGIKRALLAVDDDVRKAAKRWKREIDRELSGTDAEVKVTADTANAKKEIQAVEKGRYTAHVNVDVDDASLAKATAKIRAASGGGGGRGGGLGGSGLGGPAKLFAGTQAIGLAPNIVPAIGQVVSAAGQLSGVLGLIPASTSARQAHPSTAGS
jgi:hypothetical protein